MMILKRPLKSIVTHASPVLSRFQKVFIGIAAIGLGVLLGSLFRSSETAELTVSVLGILVVMLIIVNKPLDGVLIWLMFTPFVETVINIPMGAGIPDLEFSRFIIAFLMIFMLARAAIGMFRFARIGLAEVCIVATTIGIMASAPLALDPKGVVQMAITMHFGPLIVYFFAKNLVRNREDLHKLLLAMVILGLAVAVYAIYEHSTGNILFVQKEKGPEAFDTSYTESLQMIRGLLGRASNFARVFTSTIPLAFYLFFESKPVIRKILLVGMLAVQAYGLFLTYNRSSWYALLLSLAIIQFLYPQFRKVFLVIVFVAALTLWVTWEQVSESAVVEERVNSKVSTMEGRESRWTAGYNMWLVKPVRGWGFGHYAEKSGSFRTDGKHGNFAAIENDYLHILVGSGLIGFLPYLIFLLLPLVNSLRLFFRARAPGWSGFVKPEVIAVYWGVMLSFLIGSYSQIQTQPIVKLLPFALAGAVIGTHERWLRGSTVKTVLEDTHDA